MIRCNYCANEINIPANISQWEETKSRRIGDQIELVIEHQMRPPEKQQHTVLEWITTDKIIDTLIGELKRRLK